MLSFNCLKASVTVKPRFEHLASRRWLIQEQEGSFAKACHQCDAVLALSAHRGKTTWPRGEGHPLPGFFLACFLEKSCLYMLVGLDFNVCILLTVHVGWVWDRREGYQKVEDITSRNWNEEATGEKKISSAHMSLLHVREAPRQGWLGWVRLIREVGREKMHLGKTLV